MFAVFKRYFEKLYIIKTKTWKLKKYLMKTQVQECSIKNDFSPLYVISLSPVEDSRAMQNL